jgi:hypothetical protein
MAKKSDKPIEHYLKIPNHILNIKGLGKGEKLLLAHIYSFGRRGCWQSNETLGKMFFCSPRTISAWIGKLKKGGHILWLHPKGYYRTFWAKSHPDVKASDKLPYRDREIPKADIVSGQAKSIPLRRNLPSECAETCEATAQEYVIPLRRKLLQTNNTTPKENSNQIPATPTPLPAGGQAPALLEDRKAGMATQVEQHIRSFGLRARRTPELTPAEREQRKQAQIGALLADEAGRKK